MSAIRHLLDSPRLRLVVGFMLIVGVIHAMLGCGGVVLRRWQLRQQLDLRLQADVERIATRREMAAGDAWTVALGGASGDDSHLYAVLRDPAGQVRATSPAMHGAVLPLPDLPMAALRIREAVVEEIDDLWVHELQGRPGSIRVLTRRVEQPGLPDAVVQVARSADGVRRSMRFLWTLFWLALPASMFAAGVAGWLVSGRWFVRLNALPAVAGPADTHEPAPSQAGAPVVEGSVGRIVDELNHMLRRLERSFTAQERFITSASHELQTPVAVLLSEAQRLARTEPRPDEYREFVRTVEQEMRQLSRMVGSLLSLTRMETGDIVRTSKLLPLTELMVTAVDECCPMAQRSDITVRLELPDPDSASGQSAEPMVRGDPELLKIMLENLLRHGVHHSPSHETVTAMLELDSDQAVITVLDAGPALPDPTIRAIFTRAPTAGDDQGRTGAGLSLAIAQTVAELHGGALGVRNQEDQGVAVFVCLPLVG